MGGEVVARGRVEVGSGDGRGLVLSSVDRGVLVEAAELLVGRASRELNTGFEGVGLQFLVQVSLDEVNGRFRVMGNLLIRELRTAIVGVLRGLAADQAGDLPLSWKITAVPVDDGVQRGGSWELVAEPGPRRLLDDYRSLDEFEAPLLGLVRLPSASDVRRIELMAEGYVPKLLSARDDEPDLVAVVQVAGTDGVPGSGNGAATVLENAIKTGVTHGLAAAQTAGWTGLPTLEQVMTARVTIHTEQLSEPATTDVGRVRVEVRYPGGDAMDLDDEAPPRAPPPHQDASPGVVLDTSAAGVRDGAGSPVDVLLVDLVGPGFEWSKVLHEPLIDPVSGVTAGVFFPRPGEVGVLRAVPQRRAYTAAVHGNGRGRFSYWLTSGDEVWIDTAGLFRILLSAGLPGREHWEQVSEVWLLSCRVADLSLGNRLEEFAGLLTDAGHPRLVRGPDTPVEMLPDGSLRFPDGGTLKTITPQHSIETRLPQIKQPSQTSTDTGIQLNNDTDEQTTTTTNQTEPTTTGAEAGGASVEAVPLFTEGLSGTARDIRPGAVVRTWSGDFSVKGKPELSESDLLALVKLATEYAREVVRLWRSGRELPDIRLHLISRGRVLTKDDVLFVYLESLLTRAVNALGGVSIPLRFTRVVHPEGDSIKVRAEIKIHASPARTVAGYRAADRLEASFLESRPEFAAVEAERVRLQVGGFVQELERLRKDHALPLDLRPKLAIDVHAHATSMAMSMEAVSGLTHSVVKDELGDDAGITAADLIRESIVFGQVESRGSGVFLEVTEPAGMAVVRLPPWMSGRLIRRDKEALKWEGHFGKRWPPSLVESEPGPESEPGQDSGRPKVEEVVRSAVKVAMACKAASPAWQMPDIRLWIRADLEAGNEVLDRMFEHLEGLFRNEIRAQGGDPETLGLRFTREVADAKTPSFRHEGDVRISVRETPERTLLEYENVKTLTEYFVPSTSVLPVTAQEHIAAMLLGFVRQWLQAGDDEKPVLEFGTAKRRPRLRSAYARAVWHLVRQGVAAALQKLGDSTPAGEILRNSVRYTPYYDAKQACAVFDVREHGQTLEEGHVAAAQAVRELWADEKWVVRRDAKRVVKRVVRRAEGKLLAVWKGQFKGLGPKSTAVFSEAMAELEEQAGRLKREIEQQRPGSEDRDIRIVVTGSGLVDKKGKWTARAKTALSHLEGRLVEFLGGIVVPVTKAAYGSKSSAEEADASIIVYPETGMTEDDYRSDRPLGLFFLHSQSARLSVVVERRLRLRVQGFVSRFLQSGDGELSIVVTGKDMFLPGRLARVRELVEAAVSAYPADMRNSVIEKIMRHVRFVSDAGLVLDGGAHVWIAETAGVDEASIEQQAPATTHPARRPERVAAERPEISDEFDLPVLDLGLAPQVDPDGDDVLVEHAGDETWRVAPGEEVGPGSPAAEVEPTPEIDDVAMGEWIDFGGDAQNARSAAEAEVNDMSAFEPFMDQWDEGMAALVAELAAQLGVTTGNAELPEHTGGPVDSPGPGGEEAAGTGAVVPAVSQTAQEVRGPPVSGAEAGQPGSRESSEGLYDDSPDREPGPAGAGPSSVMGPDDERSAPPAHPAVPAIPDAAAPWPGVQPVRLAQGKIIDPHSPILYREGLEALVAGARALVHGAMTGPNAGREALDVRFTVNIPPSRQADRYFANVVTIIKRELSAAIEAVLLRDFPVDHDRPSSWNFTPVQLRGTKESRGDWELVVHPSPRHPIAYYRSLTEWTAQGIGPASVLTEADRMRVEWIGEGLVDAALSAPADRQPKLLGKVHVYATGAQAIPEDDPRTAIVRSAIATGVRRRLAETSPAGGGSRTAEQILARVDVRAIEHRDANPRLGTYQLKVERAQTGSVDRRVPAESGPVDRLIESEVLASGQFADIMSPRFAPSELEALAEAAQQVRALVEAGFRSMDVLVVLFEEDRATEVYRRASVAIGREMTRLVDDVLTAAGSPLRAEDLTWNVTPRLAREVGPDQRGRWEVRLLPTALSEERSSLNQDVPRPGLTPRLAEEAEEFRAHRARRSRDGNAIDRSESQRRFTSRSRRDETEPSAPEVPRFTRRSGTDEVIDSSPELLESSGIILDSPSAEPLEDGSMPTPSNDEREEIAPGRAAAEFEPIGNNAGGIAFSSDPATIAAWRALYDRMHTSEPLGISKVFYVFVDAVPGGVGFDGQVFTEAELGERVARSAAFQVVSQRPNVSVVVVGASSDRLGEFRKFADALRGDGPYRDVEVVNDDIGAIEQVSIPRAGDVRWKQLGNADGENVGMGFVTAGWGGKMDSSVRASSRYTDPFLVEQDPVSRTDAAVVQPWAPTTEASRTSAVRIYLQSDGTRYVVPLAGGRKARLAPEVYAEWLLSVEYFRKATGGPVRPPLIVLTHFTRAAKADGGLNARFLAKLGPWQSFHYSGAIGFQTEVGMPVIIKGGHVVERHLEFGDVAFVSAEPVFGFPTDGSGFARHPGVMGQNGPVVAHGDADRLAAFGTALAVGTHRFPGPWGDRLPLIISVEGHGRYANFRLPNGQLVEVGGREAAELWLAAPGIRRALGENPGRPVVIIGDDTGIPAAIGGFGYDFAGAMRRAGFFNDVFAHSGPAADMDTGFSLVSLPRAGDVKTLALRSAAGRLLAILVRFPGDDAIVRELQAWAWNSTPESLCKVTKLDGDWAGSRQVKTPWETIPGFIFTGDRFILNDKDSTDAPLSQRALARVLADDPEVRELLGYTVEKPIVIADLVGDTPRLEELSEVLHSVGGYAREIYRPLGDMFFEASGGILVDDQGFDKVAAPDPSSYQVVSYELANRELGTFGQFFIRDIFDAGIMYVSGLLSTAASSRYYVREVLEPDGRGGWRRRARAVKMPYERQPWVVDGHGEAEGLDFRLRTDDPFRHGDEVSAPGGPSANIIKNSRVFREAGPKTGHAELLFLNCLINKIGADGASAAYRLHQAWTRSGATANVWAANTVVAVGGKVRWVQQGGFFGKAVAPGEPQTQPVLSSAPEALRAAALVQTKIHIAEAERALAALDAADGIGASAMVSSGTRSGEPPEAGTKRTFVDLLIEEVFGNRSRFGEQVPPELVDEVYSAHRDLVDEWLRRHAGTPGQATSSHRFGRVRDWRRRGQSWSKR
ncbi:hypothetical protein [Amycolatopsis sp. EV170708-02-1]|uniref:hypothetical protein n=1 Tax=Amycolatopsis sp. EV170708-02-1 TaxID=2919322 RepID=UPI001F0C4C59|nr:hypothetical protein [Amycolatopsis sp. EV170708-02-1]UMP06968.1 hypothetical protein MJQ72_20090 [Amycolatopsis sp. EV170708-02-1]